MTERAALLYREFVPKDSVESRFVTDTARCVPAHQKNGKAKRAKAPAAPADLEEYADRFALKVDIPGVNANAAEITLEQGILTISGQRGKDFSEKDVQSVRME